MIVRGNAMKTHTSDNKGFTLVEFIVVMVILAILAAIIIPLALSHIDDAKKEQEFLDAKSFMTAIQTELMNSYSEFITGDADSEIFGTTHIMADSSDDVDLRTSKFASKVLNKTDIPNPYMLLFYTKAVQTYDNNTEGLYDGFDVISIVYWPTEDRFPIFYNFDNSSWDYGSLYTAGFMYRGSDNVGEDKKNKILPGHKYEGEKIRIFVLSYNGSSIRKMNDEIDKKMKEYKE